MYSIDSQNCKSLGVYFLLCQYRPRIRIHSLHKTFQKILSPSRIADLVLDTFRADFLKRITILH